MMKMKISGGVTAEGNGFVEGTLIIAAPPLSDEIREALAAEFARQELWDIVVDQARVEMKIPFSAQRLMSPKCPDCMKNDHVIRGDGGFWRCSRCCATFHESIWFEDKNR